MEKLWLDGVSKLNVVRIKDPNRFPELIGNAVIVSDRAVREHWLTSAPVVCLRRDFYAHERAELSRGNSYLSDQDLETLDDRCLVKVGTEVHLGSVLAAVVSPVSYGEMVDDEKLLMAIFGRSTTERDCSFRYDSELQNSATHHFLTHNQKLQWAEVNAKVNFHQTISQPNT